MAAVVLVVVGGCSPAAVEQTACERISQGSGRSFYENSRTYIDQWDVVPGWSVSTPEAQGLDRAKLGAGADALANNRTVQSLVIVRNGKIAYERYFSGGGVAKSNNIYSASKSMVQALLAIAVKKGFVASLDDTVSAYLPGYPNADRITLRDLIEMKSGLRWTEDSTEYQIEKESDRVGAILNQGLTSPPGVVFTYSSGNTHILSAVIQAATGMSTCQFALENLFAPLGISVERWVRDPKGIYAGGYNLYITPREMARFGLLYLDNGVVGGRQVVPKSAVVAAGRVLRGDFTPSYSQGWWTRVIAGHNMYFAWGYGGQFIYVIPDLNSVLVITQSTSTGNREIDSGAFIARYLIPAAA
jgi:CubicO group peptidase (beta-lactamase class C family)